ncbi:DnaB-like helicase C-terminal domain-containing protein [Streptomyces sp. NPDC048291]|uniref:DnaB-like helicase C-terminal domain-containing protein n=1 Tax=Streptomyces sp. NPDC048291 TaxID=3365530 RepID=UPI00371A408C
MRIQKRDKGAVVSVVLAPLDRFPAARNSEDFPSFTLSAAQKDFGELVSRAALGEPQVLLRGATPVAVLLPDGPIPSPSSDPTAVADAVTAGDAVSPSTRDSMPRRLATLGDAIGTALNSAPASGPVFGLSALDSVAGRLQPGKLTLVAADPSVGGSLLGLAVTRNTALVDRNRVLYAASGPSADDIFRRILSAETGGEYPRLKQGRLTPHEQDVARQLRQAPLMIDEGSNLTAEAIAETAPYVDGLSLVVVDRLQAAHSPRLPLSGDRLPNASQVLATLARTLHVPVLAVVDTSDPTLLGLLDADVLLTLTPTDIPSRVQVTVAERDFGTLGVVYLQPDLLHARFADIPGDQGPGAVAVELADAALAYTSGAERGLPASLTHTLDALRTAVLADDRETLAELTTALADEAGPFSLPDTAPGRRLAAALRALCQWAGEATNAAVYTKDAEPRSESSAQNAEITEVRVGRQAAPGPADESGEPDDEEDERDVLQPGDEEDEPKNAVFPALRILKDAVARSKMHPIPVIRTEDRANDPWPLFREHMDGEPRWVHPDVTVTRVPYIRENGKRVRRDRIDVPDSFGDGVLCLIDRNGSYPSACSAVPLAPNKLLHTGPLDGFDKSQAGIYLIDIPTWTRTDMPHPLGRLIDNPDEQGRVWVTTPHIKQLEKLARDGHLEAVPRIHDSWTGKANESLFKPFYQATQKARTELVDAGGAPYKAYKTRLSIALRLLWPKRPEQKSPFWRPDWRMSMVAEASVRHWAVAFKAVLEGHTLVALRNVDQAIFWTPPDTPPPTYRIGTGFGEVKRKFIHSGELILEGDD